MEVVAVGKLKGQKFIDSPSIALLVETSQTALNSRRARFDHYTITEMKLTIYLSISSLLACALAAILQPSPNDGPPTPNALHPRALPKFITTQSTGVHVIWGNYAINFWKSAAFLPLASAAHPMAEFYQRAALEVVRALTSHVITHTFTFGLGSLNLYVDTLDGSPIDWQMLASFASNMVGAANRGWTGHYGALVKDRMTGALTVISLEAAGGVARAWLSGGLSVEQSRNDPFGS